MKKILFLLLTAVMLLTLSPFASAEFTLPKGMKTIEDEAFMNTSAGNILTIPDGTESIGARAFAGTGLQVVVLPDTLRSIGQGAFDAGTVFDVFPKTYAKSWAVENGFDFSEICLKASPEEQHIYKNGTGVVKAINSYADQMTFQWEKSSDVENWTVIPDETGPILRIPYDEKTKEMVVRCRARFKDRELDYCDLAFVYFHGEKTTFKENDCGTISADSVYLVWNSMGKKVTYTLYKRLSGSGTGQNGWEKIADVKNETAYRVYGLTGNTSYDFKVTAAITEGVAEPFTADGEEITLKTGTEPSYFRMECSANGTALNVDWEKLERAVYDVMAVKDNGEQTCLAQNSTGDHLSYYVLEKETNYTVRVIAKIPDDSQSGGYLTVAERSAAVKTGSSDPVIENFQAIAVNDTVRLSWKPLRDTEYSLYMRGDNENEMPITTLKEAYCDIGGMDRECDYTFRVQAANGNWKSKSAETTVRSQKRNDIEYRALLVAEGNHKGDQHLNSVYNDIELVAETLASANTPSGSKYSYLRRTDLSKELLLFSIREAFQNADDNDVSLFYISTHGDISLSGKYAGQLALADKQGNEETIRLEELAAALSNVKGKVIVWLDSCGSGAAVYKEGVPQNGEPGFNPDPVDTAAFNAAAVEAFAAYDSAADADRVLAEDFAVGDTAVFDTGEFCVDGKFCVLTASAYQHSSAGNTYGIFTGFLCDGIKTENGYMHADANHDGKLTQHELFMYIKYREEHPVKGQDAQVYPLNSDYVLFVN